MIKKIYRLKESRIKRVLKYSKPFFSYGIILNAIPNNLNFNRFAIIIPEKAVPNSVSRNYFRRFFYDLIKDQITEVFFLKNTLIEKEAQNNATIKTDETRLDNKPRGMDMVFVVKKQFKLDKKDSISISKFKKDIAFLLKKIGSQNYYEG